MRRSERGFTLVEISIAIFVLAIGLVSILAVFPVGIRSGYEANAKAVSTSMAKEAREAVIHRARSGGSLCMVIDSTGKEVYNTPWDGSEGETVHDEIATGAGIILGYNTPYSSAVVGNVRDGIYRGRMGGDNGAYIWEATVGRLGVSKNGTPDTFETTMMIKHPSAQEKIRMHLSPSEDGRLWEPYLHYVFIRTAIDTRGAGPNDDPDGKVQDEEVIDEYVTYISDYIGNVNYLSTVNRLFSVRDDVMPTPGLPDIGGINIESLHYGRCASCGKPNTYSEVVNQTCDDCGQPIQ